MGAILALAVLIFPTPVGADGLGASSLLDRKLLYMARGVRTQGGDPSAPRPGESPRAGSTPGTSKDVPGPTARANRSVFRRASLWSGLVSAPDTVGYFVGLEAEFGLSNGFTMAPVVSHYEYEWEEGDLDVKVVEEGRGTGIGVSLRWYMSRIPFDGFFVEATLVIFFLADWELKTTGPGAGGEEGNQVSGEHHWAFGYSIPVHEHLAVNPMIYVGVYVTDAESGSTGFGGFGLRVSYSF